MSSPTDTNQASEDKLDEILFYLCDLSYASFTTQGEADRVADQLDYDRDEAKQAIQAIIRTEKLKLLAEVREWQIPVMALKAKKPHDEVQIQAVPVESLTELEAEL